MKCLCDLFEEQVVLELQTLHEGGSRIVHKIYRNGEVVFETADSVKAELYYNHEIGTARLRFIARYDDDQASIEWERGK